MPLSHACLKNVIYDPQIIYVTFCVHSSSELQFHAQCNCGTTSVLLRLHHHRRWHRRLPVSRHTLAKRLRVATWTRWLAVRKPQHHQLGFFWRCTLWSLLNLSLAALHLRRWRHQFPCPRFGRWQLPQCRLLHTRCSLLCQVTDRW